MRGSLNRFEAERIGDHCLNSTVSVLTAKGIVIGRVWERVPTRFGNKVTVCRYSVPQWAHSDAERVLERL